MILHNFKETFDQLRNALCTIDGTYYAKPSRLLDNATIGKHTRHIIELVQCLIAGYDKGEVNYDKRERNLTIETDIEFAMACLQSCMINIEKADKAIIGHYEIDTETVAVGSTYFREIMYNIEHCTHHQALIKVAFNEFNIDINEKFGVATATLKYRAKCAQ
jgi:hypothetical protein